MNKNITFVSYCFDIVQRHLKRGDSYLVNLTSRVEVETNLSLLDIYQASKAKYKLWIKDKFVCFSPETFLQINNGMISCFPMKGTISADIPDAKELLMANRKETAEHATIVDLIRNDLSMVANHVSVENYRYIEKLHTNKGDIYQTSSRITGNATLLAEQTSLETHRPSRTEWSFRTQRSS